MKKIDNRGFVMVETIIVAVFVIGICTFLFKNFLPLIGDYERVSEYDTVDSKYKLHEIRKMILRDIEKDGSIKNIFTSIPSGDGYVKYSIYTTEVEDKTITKHSLCDSLVSINYCNTLLGEYYLNVKDIYITSFKLSKMKASVKTLSGNRALKEYIKYLPSYSKYSSTYDNYYRIIVSFNNGEMANIEVHYEI